MGHQPKVQQDIVRELEDHGPTDMTVVMVINEMIPVCMSQ